MNLGCNCNWYRSQPFFSFLPHGNEILSRIFSRLGPYPFCSLIACPLHSPTFQKCPSIFCLPGRKEIGDTNWILFKISIRNIQKNFKEFFLTPRQPPFTLFGVYIFRPFSVHVWVIFQFIVSFSCNKWKFYTFASAICFSHLLVYLRYRPRHKYKSTSF